MYKLHLQRATVSTRLPSVAPRKPTLISGLKTTVNTMAKRNKSGPGAPKMESLMKSPLGDAIAQASPRIQPSTTERAVPVNPGSDKFDATKHLSYVPPKEIKTMKDLGYPNDLGVSPVAVSQPFQLFTEEAVDVMRKEIFQKGVQENCTFSSNLAARQLRGYTKE
jgi:hypothetical protein